MIIEDTESFENVFVSNYWYDADGERTVKTSGENEAIYVNPYLVAGQGGEYTKHIYIAALGESLFPSSLAFPRRAKVIFRVVWHFRAWRKSFPEWFGISAPGESCFPNGLAFPRRAKVVSRMVWHFRAGRKLFPEWFGISAHGESHFPRGLAFPRRAKVVFRMVWHFRAGRKSFSEWFDACANRLFIKRLLLSGKPSPDIKVKGRNPREDFSPFCYLCLVEKLQ